MNHDESELIHFSEKWDKAMVSNNAEEIGKFMADDWIIVATDNGISTKTKFLQDIIEGKLVHTRMDTDEVHVKIYSDTGILVCKGTSAGTYNGKPFSFYEWSTNIFIKCNNGWKCVSTMLTLAS